MTTHRISSQNLETSIDLRDGDTLEFTGEALSVYRSLYPLALRDCSHVDTDGCTGSSAALSTVLHCMADVID
jgi:hypothetical protein